MPKPFSLRYLHILPAMLIRHTVVLPALVGLAMVALIIGGWMLLPSSAERGLSRETQRNLEHLSARLEAHFQTRLTISEHVRREIIVGHVFGKSEFLSEARALHELFRDFQAFNWIDSNGVIRWIYPEAQNRPALHVNVRHLNVPGPVLRAAEKTGKPRVTPPIELAQGGRGFAAYIPVIRKGTLLGSLNIVFRTEPLLTSMMEADFLQLYDVRILDGDALVYQSPGAPALDGNGSFSHSIAMGDRQWDITLAPTPANIAEHSSIIETLVVAFLLMLSLAFAWLMHLAMVRQKKLYTSDKLFRTFIEYSPSAIFIKDTKGRYIHVNSKWHEWFNPENKEIEGMKLIDLYPGDHARESQAMEDKVLRDAAAVEYETMSPHADGTTVPALVHKFPIFDNHGQLIAMGGINTNISANKKTEETLRHALIKAEEANQSKSNFLATMSHELRTPLNAIIGFSDILIGQYFGTLGNARYMEYVKDINQSGHHLLSLINEVLDISAIELGRRKLQLEPLAVQDLLSDCVKSVRQRADCQRIMIALVAPSDLSPIPADKTAMRQIFLNLLTNAIKFSHAGDKITVSAQATGDDIVISVADTGDGIRKDQIATVTEPFVKGHSTSHVTHEGVGLGLSIVKAFVAAHNGTLDIESEVGRGTTVTISFPRSRDRMVA
ncbi:PAS domain S-box protein [Sneathiella chungangensis]|uniref:histidine kinase n=1 Tax=Sneathiella chungangensis TaxID=1418234 RepID=A0A845MEE1_9PROT|nr:ATP-binding protein [Sneathiella chungangensis]MZR22239.1 PAS domain S-box protein [Sneathiella chungangensis]